MMKRRWVEPLLVAFFAFAIGAVATRGAQNYVDATFHNLTVTGVCTGCVSIAPPNAISPTSVNGVINVMAYPYSAVCDGVTDDTAAFGRAAVAPGGAIYVPSVRVSSQPAICLVGLVSFPNTIHAIFSDNNSFATIKQLSAGTRTFYWNKINGLEVRNLKFVGVSGTAFLSANAPICVDDVPAAPNCGGPDNSVNVTIGDNQNIYIHDVYIQNYQYGAVVEGVKGLRFENNICDNDATCLQAIDTNDGFIANNQVFGQQTTTFTSMIAVQNTGKPLPTPDQHNRGVHVLSNKFRDVSYGQDILVHDCIDCEVTSNVHTNSRQAITVGPAFNFQQILHNISVTGNVMSGNDNGNPVIVGNFGINVGGDFAACTGPCTVSGSPPQLWQATHVYNAGDWVAGSASSVIDARDTRFQAGSNCTSGTVEPNPWNFDPLGTITIDNAGGGNCSWTSYGLWTATNIAITGNTIRHTNYVEKVGVNQGAIQIGGSTDNLAITANAIRDAAGVGIGIRYLNRRLNIVGNDISNITNGFGATQRAIFFDNNSSNVQVDGQIIANYLSDATQCIFDRVDTTLWPLADQSKMTIRDNNYQNCGTNIDVGNIPSAVNSAKTAFAASVRPHTFFSFPQTPYAPQNIDDVMPCDASGGATVFTMPASTTVPNRVFTIIKADTTTNACTPTAIGADKFFSTGGVSTTRGLSVFGQAETYIATTSINGIVGWLVIGQGAFTSLTNTGASTLSGDITISNNAHTTTTIGSGTAPTASSGVMSAISTDSDLKVSGPGTTFPLTVTLNRPCTNEIHPTCTDWSTAAPFKVNSGTTSTFVITGMTNGDTFTCQTTCK